MQGCMLPSESAGPWSDQLLLQTINNYAGTGADAGQPEGIRFLRGVAHLVKKRLKSTTQESATQVTSAPAVFLLCPAEPQTVDKAALKFHPMLDNGLTPVEGKLWLVGPVVASGQCMALEMH